MNPNKIRKVYAPYSTTGEQVGQTPLEGYVDVAQAIYPAVNTGQIGKDGEWSGVTVSDKTFNIDAEHEGVPNSASVLSPQTANRDFIDMTGYNDMFIAIKVSNGGNYVMTGVMGPDTNTFANLTPVNAAATLRGMAAGMGRSDFTSLLLDGAETLTADVWNIYFVANNLADQKNLQIKITNNSGDVSNIQFAHMRIA